VSIVHAAGRCTYTSPRSCFSSSTGSTGAGVKALDGGGLIGDATPGAAAPVAVFFCCRFLSCNVAQSIVHCRYTSEHTIAFARAALAARSSSSAMENGQSEVG
jgi:hypothetical protein